MIGIWVVLAVVLVAAVTVSARVMVRRRAADRHGGLPVQAGEAPPIPPVPQPPIEVGPVAERAPPPAAEAEPVVPAPEEPGGQAVPEPVPDLPEPVPDLKDRMGRTRGRFGAYLRSLRTRGSVDDTTWDELEEALLGADVGVVTTAALLDDLRTRVGSGELFGAEAVVEALKRDMRQVLSEVTGRELQFIEGACNVWLFVGVNGVGKTTTIGKVARQQAALGRSVLLAAGDTFRAAASQQLATWAERAGVDVVQGAEGGDPSAVVFDAVQRAAARGHQLVLADTAGRLHTKVNLVEELKKIRRVAERPPGQVTEVLLVLDATTGQNGLTQARQFLQAVGVTGVVLTKLDGTAKGGIVVAVHRELGIPVKLVGIGEGVTDLVPFDPAAFVDALFD